jgi:hypothetical protein
MIIRIVAAVVDTRLITLYEAETGKAYEIRQGDPRIQQIVDNVLPKVQNGQIADFHYEAGPGNTNPYKDFQEASGGVVKFFRIAKRKLFGLFGSSDDEIVAQEGVYGHLPAPPAPAPIAAPAAEEVESITDTAELTPDMSKAVSEIIKHAEPVTKKDFSERHTTEEETMIAVTGTGKEQRILPGVEQLRGQFAHAAKLGSTQGVQRLIERLTAIIDKRQHSVQDVLRFLEKGDLPVADDGSIIAYKRLYRKGDRYVDPHTRKVTQRVGSYVCLDESLVDKNRRNECSNGLHIGRRQYMGSFSGDVITICKIDPEDVIVVPHNDPNKVRVCGYHIISELGDAEFKIICRNEPMTETEKAKSLLARAIRGEHIGRIEEVKITGSHGNGLVITPLENGKKVIAKGKVEAPNAVALDDATVVEPDPKKGPEARADVKAVINTVTPAQAPDPEPAPTSAAPVGSKRVQTMRSFYASLIATKDEKKRLAIATEAFNFKKAAKVGWQTLGLSEAEAKIIVDTATQKPAELPPVNVAPPEPEPEAVPVLGVPEAKETITGAPDAPAAGNFNRKETAASLFTTASEGTNHINVRREALIGLKHLKQKARVSWDALGLHNEDIRILEQALSQEAILKPADLPVPLPRQDPLNEEYGEPAPKKKWTKPEVTTTKLSKAEMARELFSRKEWAKLHEFKKSAKKSWQVLGFNEGEEKTILANKS